MANKKLQNEEARIVLLRLFFLLVISLATSLGTTLQAQNINKSYVASAQADGILYFIVPQKGFSNPETNAKFVYDITYKTSQDSAIFNFSYFDKNEVKLDSIGLKISNNVLILYPKRIFVEPTSNSWHYRYTSLVLFNELERFYQQSSENAEIIFYSPNGFQKVTIGKRTWKDQSPKMKKIFTMIKYNKQ